MTNIAFSTQQKGKKEKLSYSVAVASIEFCIQFIISVMIIILLLFHIFFRKGKLQTNIKRKSQTRRKFSILISWK